MKKYKKNIIKYICNHICGYYTGSLLEIGKAYRDNENTYFMSGVIMLRIPNTECPFDINNINYWQKEEFKYENDFKITENSIKVELTGCIRDYKVGNKMKNILVEFEDKESNKYYLNKNYFKILQDDDNTYYFNRNLIQIMNEDKLIGFIPIIKVRFNK